MPFLGKSARLGNRIELWTAEGKARGFFNSSPWQEACIQAADRFLASLGYLTGEPTIQADNAAVLTRQDLSKRR